MGLREIAEQDQAFILEDEEHGFGWEITLTDPDGLTDTFTGYSQDVYTLIDADTEIAASGRVISVALRISSILAAGFSDIPEGVQSQDSLPWRVQFDDLQGDPYSFAVRDSEPDRTLGMVVCFCVPYKEST